MSRALFGVLLLIVVVTVGYYGYTYVKETPPTWLIKLLTHTDPPPPLPTGDIAPLQTPEGFVATIFSREVPGARVMIRDPKGTLVVSETSEGKVVALPDLDTDGKADRTVTILQGLNQPHGIAIVCSNTGFESADQDNCMLYVAETDALKSYKYDADTMQASLKETLATLPSGSGHFTRTLLVEPDQKHLLISVGSSCNVCHEDNSQRATVLEFDLATKQLSTFATGLRNTVFMDIDPVIGKIWGSDNGRDLLGDDIPPDEINILEKGKNYGWPICYGKNIHDTDFDKNQYIRDPCADSTPPHIELQAHSAALGLTFIPEEGWPEDMGNDLLVAYHGSWNRTKPTGYKVVRFNLDQNRQAVGEPIDFLTGFLTTNNTDDAIGRPVGLLAVPGGTVYVSDDRADAIYKIVRSTTN